ncbi:MAG TPA: aminopeptidase P family N-terminal domain-containing protein, partial [Anaerolineaceae bacterium]|nr:aminopeptidase P family N-terminal domain-containing protein [Anaerolineaceae bacterium]
MTKDRLTRLANLLAPAGLDAVLINPGPTLIYLTGLQFHLSERPVTLLVQPNQDATIVLPELEQGKLEAYDGQIRSFAYGENPQDWPAVFAQACQASGLSNPVIGVEPNRLRFL